VICLSRKRSLANVTSFSQN